MTFLARMATAIAILLAVAACGNKQRPVIDAATIPADKAVLVVYRTDTSFHAYNPEKPFVYLNDEQIGTLGVGETITREVAPGKATVMMRNVALFMPTGVIGKVEAQLEGGKVYYVRYARDFTGATSVGTAIVMSSVSQLQFVDPEIGATYR